MVVLLDTRSRILEVASVLFSERGFEGASIRELARLAEVNLAAINYHFASKENLYMEVIRHSVETFRKKVGSLYGQNQWETESFILAIYDMLISHGPDLINNFKVILSDVNHAENIIPSGQVLGPPGAEYIRLLLEKELGSDLDQELLDWGVHLLFTQVVHTALIASSPVGQRQCPESCSYQVVASRLKTTVNSVRNYLLLNAHSSTKEDTHN